MHLRISALLAVTLAACGGNVVVDSLSSSSGVSSSGTSFSSSSGLGGTGTGAAPGVGAGTTFPGVGGSSLTVSPGVTSGGGGPTGVCPLDVKLPAGYGLCGGGATAGSSGSAMSCVASFCAPSGPASRTATASCSGDTCACRLPSGAECVCVVHGDACSAISTGSCCFGL